ncbi:hypothetical protein NV63_06760 [Elizabethkingia anophelis]|nr:hypothetical protein NV63_06760 [Elizabethkingia anophelis]
MKRLEEIKNEYARNHGFDDWKDIWYDTVNFKQVDERYNEITELYACEVAQASLQKAAEVVSRNYNDSYECKQDILNPKNITLI